MKSNRLFLLVELNRYSTSWDIYDKI